MGFCVYWVEAGPDLSLEDDTWLAPGPRGLGGTDLPTTPGLSPFNLDLLAVSGKKCALSAGLAELVICELAVVINLILTLLGRST